MPTPLAASPTRPPTAPAAAPAASQTPPATPRRPGLRRRRGRRSAWCSPHARRPARGGLPVCLRAGGSAYARGQSASRPSVSASAPREEGPDRPPSAPGAVERRSHAGETRERRRSIIRAVDVDDRGDRRRGGVGVAAQHQPAARLPAKRRVDEVPALARGDVGAPHEPAEPARDGRDGAACSCPDDARR